MSSRNIICRHPALVIFTFALALRLCLVTVVASKYNGTLFGDDQLYFHLIQTFSNGQSGEWSSYYHELWRLSLSFLMPGAIVFEITGGVKFLVLSVSAIVGSIIPALLFRLLSKHIKVKFAFATSILLAIMPSQVLWSSLLLKDTYIALGLIAISFFLRRWCERNRWSDFFIGVMSISCLLFYVQRIRLHTLIVVCIAVLITVIITGGGLWIPRILAVCLLFALMPWMIGGGLFGKNFTTTLGNGLEVQRQKGAVGATTAIVDVPTTTVLANTSSSSSSSSSVPSSSPLVDELKYLPSGLKVMLLDPVPSQLSRSKSLYLAFAEHLIWYPALLLCFYGASRRRKWTADLIFAGFLGIGLCSMWALHEGNFGTAFRHRTEFVWIIFLFAGIGLQQISDDLKKRKELVSKL